MTHGLQHTRLPCCSLSPGVCSNSYPLSQWCHPTILPSVIPFFSCPQSFPASESFPVSQLFVSGGQRNGALALAWVLPMNIQGWFLLGLTGLISLLSKGLSRVFSSTIAWKHQFFNYSIFSFLFFFFFNCRVRLDRAAQLVLLTDMPKDRRASRRLRTALRRPAPLLPIQLSL